MNTPVKIAPQNARYGKAGRVIYSIADHCDALTRSVELADRGDFLLGLEAGAEFVEVEFALEQLGGLGAITGEHDAAQADPAEFSEHAGSLGTDVIAQKNATEQFTVADPDFRNAGGGGRRIGVRTARELAQDEFAPAKETRLVPKLCAQAKSGDGLEVIERERWQRVLFAIARDSAGERVGGEAFHRARKGSHVLLAARREALDLLHLQFARGQRAGLVERDDIHVRKLLNGRATTEENAAPRAPRDGREHG